MEKVSLFAEESGAGEEMILNSELSSYDHRLVHEFAAQLGLGHRSEGIVGEDTRIVLRKENNKFALVANRPTEHTHCNAKKVEPSIDHEVIGSTAVPSAFGMLSVEDSDDDSSVAKEDKSSTTMKPKDPPSSSPNSLLADLRREREARRYGRWSR